MDFKVSLIALFLGTLINVVLGALWYSPLLFARLWMKEAKVTMADIQSDDSNMAKVYGITALTALITSYMVGFLLKNLGLEGYGQGLVFVLVLWLGSHLPTIVKRWGFEKNSMALGLINHGYDFVVYLLLTGLYLSL